MKAVVFHEFGNSDVLQLEELPEPSRSRRGRRRHHGGGAQPSRRRRPRGRLPFPGRATARARRRGRGSDRRGRAGRRGLGAGRPRHALHHEHVRELPVLRHRARVALRRGRLHQLHDRWRLCRAACVLGATADPRAGWARRRRGGRPPGRVRNRVAHALHARTAATRRDSPDQLRRQRHRLSRSAARPSRRRLRDRYLQQGRQARAGRCPRHGRRDQLHDLGRHRGGAADHRRPRAST